MKTSKSFGSKIKNKRARRSAPPDESLSSRSPTPPPPPSPPQLPPSKLRVQPLGFPDAEPQQQQQSDQADARNRASLALAHQDPGLHAFADNSRFVNDGRHGNVVRKIVAKPAKPIAKRTRSARASARARHRGLVRVPGRPSKKLLAELFGPHEDCIAEAEEAREQLAQAQEEIEALKSLVAAQEKKLAAVERVNSVVDMLRKTGLELRRTHIRTALILSAQTPDEMAAIKRKDHVLHNLASKARNDRQQLALAHGVSAVDDRRSSSPPKAHCYDISCFQTLVFGAGGLRRCTDTMVFFTNPHFPIGNATVLAAFADGKFSGCVRGWKQSFELRLLLEREFASPFARKPGQPQPVERFTATFAFALLRGTAAHNYQEFFTAARDYGCPAPPLLMTDFELAISSAAREVWPGVVRRGCFYHFAANLRDRSDELEWWLPQKLRPETRSLLAVAPFIVGLPHFLARFIDRLELSREQLMRSIDFKLAIYVADVYLLRFRHLFFADLDLSPLRTNNSCEGSNSGVARTHAFRLNRQAFLDVVEERFKLDSMANWDPPKRESPYGAFLQLLQRLSRSHPDTVLRFLCGGPEIAHWAGPALLADLQLVQPGPPHPLTPEAVQAASRQLRSLSAAHRAFHKAKRSEEAALRSHARELRALNGGMGDRKEERKHWRVFNRSNSVSDNSNILTDEQSVDEQPQEPVVGEEEREEAEASQSERAAPQNNNNNHNNNNANNNNNQNNNNDSKKRNSLLN